MKATTFVARGAYSTAEVGRLLGVSAKTVAKAMDSGEMPSFKLPGSKFRRVTQCDLWEWLWARPEYGFATERLQEAIRAAGKVAPEYLLAQFSGGGPCVVEGRIRIDALADGALLPLSFSPEDAGVIRGLLDDWLPEGPQPDRPARVKSQRDEALALLRGLRLRSSDACLTADEQDRIDALCYRCHVPE